MKEEIKKIFEEKKISFFILETIIYKIYNIPY